MCNDFINHESNYNDAKQVRQTINTLNEVLTMEILQSLFENIINLVSLKMKYM